VTRGLPAAISQKELLHALWKAQVDAVELLRSEMAHHALCWRSIAIVPSHAEFFEREVRSIVDTLDDESRIRAGKDVQDVQINLECASNEVSLGYTSVTRRTVIVLADILDNLFQSTLGLCLLHLDPSQTSVKEVTRFKGSITKERDLQIAIKSWERSLSGQCQTRTARMIHMLVAFFPNFQAPNDIGLLDDLFEARNAFTHAMIRLDENSPAHVENPWTLSMVDEGFRVEANSCWLRWQPYRLIRVLPFPSPRANYHD
jgi:hypothetical protein